MPVIRLDRKPIRGATAGRSTAAATAPARSYGFTWEEVWALFKRSRELGNYGANGPVRERTIQEYKYDFDRFASFMEERQIFRYTQMKRGDVEDFIMSLQLKVKKKQWKESSAFKVYRSIKAIFNFIAISPDCQSEGMECFKTALPKIPKNPPRPYVPTSDVMVKFITAFDKNTRQGLRDYTFASLIISAGLRSGEACFLQEDDLDFQGRMIHVPDEGKTGKRIVPMSEQLSDILRHWLKMRKHFVTPGTKELFITQYGFPCTPHVFDQSFSEHRRKTGLGATNDGNLSPHTLRHYFCTYYLINGGSLHNLQYITGHTSLDMLMNYVHIAKERTQVTKEHREVDPLSRLDMLSPGKKRRNR
jgi:site-specific recombinase XerD